MASIKIKKANKTKSDALFEKIGFKGHLVMTIVKY